MPQLCQQEPRQAQSSTNGAMCTSIIVGTVRPAPEGPVTPGEVHPRFHPGVEEKLSLFMYLGTRPARTLWSLTLRKPMAVLHAS